MAGFQVFTEAMGEKMIRKLVVRNTYESEVANYYDKKQKDFNFILGSGDDLIHHHFGIGDYDDSALISATQDDINRQLHELENKQVRLLISAIGNIQEEVISDN